MRRKLARYFGNDVCEPLDGFFVDAGVDLVLASLGKSDADVK